MGVSNGTTCPDRAISGARLPRHPSGGGLCNSDRAERHSCCVGGRALAGDLLGVIQVDWRQVADLRCESLDVGPVSVVQLREASCRGLASE
jgi:hypothetical protein